MRLVATVLGNKLSDVGTCPLKALAFGVLPLGFHHEKPNQTSQSTHEGETRCS